MDIWSKEKRSQVMSKISGKNTKPEQRARKLLTSLGLRYRLHVNNLPGKPDIVLRKYNFIIFIHGCFWHLHSKCRDGTIPKSRENYWKKKLLGNKQRDSANIKELRAQGWKVLRLWECELEKKPKSTVKKIMTVLESKNERRFEYLH